MCIRDRVKIVPLSPSIGAIASGVATWLLAIGFSTIGGGLAAGFGGGVNAGCSKMFGISMHPHLRGFLVGFLRGFRLGGLPRLLPYVPIPLGILRPHPIFLGCHQFFSLSSLGSQTSL